MSTQTTTATELDLDAIEERERTILPGPWRVGEMAPTGPDLWQLPTMLDRQGPDGPDSIEVCAVEYETQGFQYPHDDARRDAEFIAAARTDVPALVAEVRRLLAELEQTRDQRDAARAMADELRTDLRAADESNANLQQHIADVRSGAF